MPEFLIWTEGCRPMIMGGDVYAPLGTVVHVDDPIDIGKDIHVHVVTFDDGRTAICEATSGAIVGTDLDAVRNDVATADAEVMVKQLAQARHRSWSVVPLDLDEFLSIWTG